MPCLVYMITTLSFSAKKMGQPAFKEVVKERSIDFLSDEVASKVMEEKDERGREEGAEGGPSE